MAGLELLRRLTLAVDAAESLTAICEIALEAALALAGAAGASVLLIDGSTGWRMQASRGLGASTAKGLESCRPWVEDAAATTTVVDVSDAGLLEAGVSASAFVPLRGSGRLLGALALHLPARRALRNGEASAAETIAGLVGLAIAWSSARAETGKTLRREQAARREAESLLAVIQAATSTLDLTESMRRMARAVGRFLQADTVGAYMLDPAERQLYPVAGYRVPKHLVDTFLAFPIPLEHHRVLEQVWATAQPVWSSDVPSHPLVDRATVERFPHQSDLFLPIVVGGKPIGGFFCIWWTSRRTFSGEEVRLVAEMSRQASLAVERAQHVRTTQEESRAKDEFLGMLSHELRNPLSVIVNGLAVLDRTSRGDDATRGIRAIIQRQTHHLARLLDDLLDVTRIKQRRIELRLAVLDVREMVHRAVEAQRDRIEAKRQRLALELAEAPVMVEGDPDRLQQVVANLLSNASKYTPPGGAIRVQLSRGEAEAVLRVEDDGVGIAAADLPRIFDLFMQANPAGARGEGGLGIGLTLVRDLVELHGGTIVASSAGPGRGSTFTVRLPTASGVRGPAAQPTAHAPSPRTGRLLVIEDNDDVRAMLVAALVLAGHDVLEAATGQAGVERAIRESPDTVLVDIGLPDLDGHEVGRRLRQALGPAVRLVALTGYGQPQDRERSAQAGFDAHLVKPVDPDRLAAALAALPLPERRR